MRLEERIKREDEIYWKHYYDLDGSVRSYEKGKILVD